MVTQIAIVIVISSCITQQPPRSELGRLRDLFQNVGGNPGKELSMAIWNWATKMETTEIARIIVIMILR